MRLKTRAIPLVRSPLTCAALLFALLAFWAVAANAGCVKSRGDVCGDPNVCVSDKRHGSGGDKDPNSNLPPVVCTAIKEIAAHFKSRGKIEVLAADRRRRCRTSGGAGCNSMHARGRAVDLYLPGVPSAGGSCGNRNGLAAQKRDVQPLLRRIQANQNAIRYNLYTTGTLHLDNSHINPGLPNGYSSCLGREGNRNRYKRTRHYKSKPTYRHGRRKRWR